MSLPRARATVIIQQDQGEYFLVDTEGGEVFEVNATAAKIFSFCQAGGSIDDAVAALAEGLSVTGQEAMIREDVEATARQLEALGLCEKQSSS